MNGDDRPLRAAQHEIITVQGAQGYPIQSRYWRGTAPRALLIMVHGVVSHSLWLESIAVELTDRQINVLAMDRRGAGLNLQERGDAPSAEALLADLDSVVQWARQQDLPLHLCGFCWGSNYVVNYLHTTQGDFASCLFLAPSLFPSALIQQRPFATGDGAEATEEPVMPIDQFTDGPCYDNFIVPDPLRLNKVSRRLNTCMQQFSSGLWMKFLRLKLPCLMLLGSKDTVVDNTATEKVFERLGVSPKALYRLPACHGIQFDQPEAAAELIAHWVNAPDTLNKDIIAEHPEREHI